MRERVSASWIWFFILTFGLLVLMVGARPELQPTRGREQAPGPTIEMVGHAITWSAGSVLVIRLARSTHAQLRARGRDTKPS